MTLASSTRRATRPRPATATSGTSSSPTYGKAIRLIKFFGHSLSEADYSYLQSLFDAVDIYDGDTALAFCYSKYGSGTEQEDDCYAVAKLLATYGKTLDNKDHGQNLMHKLLLEGRLMVRELPS